MKRVFGGLLILVMMLSLSGCFMDPAESLYAVPLQPESYYNLQSEIEKLIEGGAVYSPPSAGENQQTVQLVNLDGDRDEEAVVFLKSAGDAPLSVCVFDRQEEQYLMVDQVFGSGYAFDCVWYDTIDDAPGQELLVGRKVSEGVPLVLSVYSLQDGALVEHMSTNYAEFTIADLDADGRREIVSFRAGGDAQNGVAEYYRWSEGELVRARECNLSAPVTAIKRIITGKMCRNVPAVFVGSTYGENMLVTDIFALREGSFSNMTLHEDTGLAVATMREYYVYSGDIDADGLIELPRLVALPPLPNDPNSENQALIYWFNLLENGETEEKTVTYHNYSAGWYIRIPEPWQKKLGVTRSVSYASTPVHSFVDRESQKELFAITAFNDEKHLDTMEHNGWMQLAQKGDITYACRFDEAAGLTQQSLRELFRFIRLDWNTGET
ncbi:MAG: hypothetical protein J6K89_01395 [Oscillospiraceae bacterium]|nr:hypothetical protein [Oscillospiraceae bacterium]